MSTETTDIEFIPYQYEDILTDIQNRFVSKGYTDVEYEGSNIHNMSTVIAGVLSNLSLNMNMNIQETIISTAKNKSNILKKAQNELGYNRVGNVSYQYEIEIQAKLDDSLPIDDTTKRDYTLDKYTEFTSNGKSYYYFGDYISRQISNNDITLNEEVSIFSIIVKEGTLYKFVDNQSKLSSVVYNTSPTDVIPNTYVDLLYTDIEENGVEAYFTYVDVVNNTAKQNEPWEQSNSILIENTDVSRKFLIIEDPNTEYFRLYWRFAGIGTSLVVGSIINVNVLTSSGSLGASDGSFNNNNWDQYNESVTELIIGVDKENKQKVATNAPRFNNTANRCITRPDYIAFSNRRPEVSSTSVWGSEDEIPLYRKEVWLSYVPFNRNNELIFNNNNNTYELVIDDSFYLNDTEVLNIQEYYKQYCIPGLKHRNRHPNYINFEYEIQVVNYDSSKSVNDINISIFNVINDYFNTTIEKFNSEYFNASIIRKINEISNDISGLNLNLLTTTSICDKLVNVLEGSTDSELTYILNLSYPYTYPFDDVTGLITTSNLPVIDTPNFLNSEDLTVDFNNEITYETNIAYNIYLGVNIIGRYIVVKSSEEFIRIELFVKGDGEIIKQEYIDSTLLIDDLNNCSNIIIKYSHDNFYLYRNSIPRLSKIKFIT